MTERPIIFNGAMVRAILDGRKTQTRRVVRPQPPQDVKSAGVLFSQTEADGEWSWLDDTSFDWASTVGGSFRCPYGKTGDQLWVRETWRAHHFDVDGGSLELDYRADSASRKVSADRWGILIEQERWKRHGGWRPSIHMPCWASRITLEVTGVRVERLQEISGEDAKREGLLLPECADSSAYIQEFATLWDSINAKRGYSWESNPWVWAVEFKVA